MKKVRIGIVGLGNMGFAHAQNILAGKINRLELGAVADTDPGKLLRVPQAKGFKSAAEMMASGLIDAILIATPHYDHTTIGIAALKAGLHVMVEKPISVHRADCERLIAAYAGREGKQVFAAMFNQRTDLYYRKIRELIRSGELGEIRRVNWIITNWFRTHAYYASGGWRATWAGEGGGVLLNQCPHNLDLFQWMFGMPVTLSAQCAFGRYHDIEVEDDVTATMRFANGATGVFITSTGEAPGTNRLEITAERGKLVYENDRISYTRNEVPMGEFSRTTPHTFATPATWDVTVPAAGSTTVRRAASALAAAGACHAPSSCNSKPPGELSARSTRLSHGDSCRCYQVRSATTVAITTPAGRGQGTSSPGLAPSKAFANGDTQLSSPRSASASSSPTRRKCQVRPSSSSSSTATPKVTRCGLANGGGTTIAEPNRASAQRTSRRQCAADRPSVGTRPAVWSAKAADKPACARCRRAAIASRPAGVV
jgi:predicted dehydrogenase